MDRLKLSVLGFCEVRWKNAGQLVKGDNTVIYSGGDQHHGGVALILYKQLSKSVFLYGHELTEYFYSN